MPCGKGGEGCIEWRYERIYEPKPTRLPRRAPLAAAAPVDLRLGPRRASSGGAGPPGRGAVRALRLSPAAADPRWGTLPAPRRAPAAPGAAPRPHAAPAATPQKAAGEQRPRYAAIAKNYELFGEEIRGIISKHEPFLERKGSTQRTLRRGLCFAHSPHYLLKLFFLGDFFFSLKRKSRRGGNK